MKLKRFFNKDVDDTNDYEINQVPGKIKVQEINSMSIWNIVWNSKFTKRLFFRNDIEKQINFNQVIHGINYNKAKEEFGQQNGTFRGEFFYKVWKFEYAGYEFLLFCDGPNAGKGSSIEIIGNFDQEEIKTNKNLYDAVKEFQDKLYDIFKD